MNFFKTKYQILINDDAKYALRKVHWLFGSRYLRTTSLKYKNKIQWDCYKLQYDVLYWTNLFVIEDTLDLLNGNKYLKNKKVDHKVFREIE